MGERTPVPKVLVNNRHVVIPGSEFDAFQEAPQYSSGEPSIEFEERLDLILRESLPSHFEEPSHPIAQPHILQTLLPEEKIRDLLTEKLHIDQVESLIERICRGSGQSRIVILAMLILVHKSEMIRDVLSEGISDEDLPFVSNNAAMLRFMHRNSSNQTLRCFNKLPLHVKGLINRFQWSLRTPFMEVKGPDFKPYKKTFDDKTVLPWTSKNRSGERMQSGKTERIGGYSAVYHCHIDDRFHGFNEVLKEVGLEGGKGEFALKVINPYSRSEKDIIGRRYEDEEKQLTNFNGTIHRHLVTLLATFTLKESKKNHFLFPWAESDLFTYWETQQNPDSRWISVQLAGLVDALAKIHNPPHLPNLFGRHGDMKPDNILWFTPYEKDKRGILVISDMGFTAVNTELSRSNQSNGKPRTPEYRAPELDVNGSPVSRQYDIWPLGCIFLEMMVWLVGGNGFVREFRQARNTVDVDGTITPTFFNLLREEGRAVVKPEVTEWMEKVSSHQNATQFIRDVVQIIKEKMLRPLAQQRAIIASLQSDFNAINRKCQQKDNSSYLIRR